MQNEYGALIEDIWQAGYYGNLAELMKEASQSKDEDGEEESEAPVVFPDLGEDEMKAALGRQWKNQLQTLKAFVEVFQYVTSTNEISVLPLSCKSKTLLKMFKNPMKISRMLEAAQKVGLLKCVEEKYHFGSSGNAYARKYAYNKAAQAVLKRLFAEYSIEGLPLPPSATPLSMPSANAATLEEEYRRSPYQFRFTSQTRMRNVSDDLVMYGLEKTYPQIGEYTAKVENLNAHLPIDERIAFKPSITRKGDTITKIGIRATNPLASYPTPKENGNKSKLCLRPEMLDKKFGFGNWTEVDVCASVPRVNYLLNFGVWLPNEMDLYRLMFAAEFADKEQRRQFKNLFMRLYFSNSAKQICHQLRLQRLIDGFIMNHGMPCALYTIGKAREGVFNTIGTSFQSEIFLHESAIYIDVFSELKKHGFQFIQVYDAFFIQGQLEDEEIEGIHGIIKKCAEAYYLRYIAPGKVVAVDDTPKKVCVA